VRKRIGIEVGDNTDLLLFESYNNGENRIRFIQNLVTNYLDHLIEVDKLTPKTMQTYYDAVKRFYVKNEVQLNWDNIKDHAGSTSNIIVNVDMPYTYEEIHRMLDKADERERLIIYLLCSTGIRQGAVPELKIGHLKYIEEYQIYEITVYKGFKEEYVTFCSLECAAAINSYLDFRRRYGEKITPESYLIRKQFDRQNPRPQLKKVSDATDPPHKHKVSESNIQYIIYQLIYDSGIRDNEDKKKRNGERHKNMAAHAFRNFFQNKCLESGIDPMYVESLMEHNLGVTKHYYRPSSINGENSLLELYVKKAMPLLTISDESRLKLKNRELEMQMAAEEARFKAAIEEAQSLNHDSITALSEQLLKMQKRIEELEASKNKA
jgi:integrase